MFGLVVATAKGIAEKLKPTTLEEELAVRGISTISLDKVRLFQKTHLEAERLAGNAGTEAAWKRVSIENWKYFGFITPDASSTVERAKTIPDSHVFVERFDADPFVFIERPKRFPGISMEVCCIAFWDAPNFRP